ncbi:transposable element Tcb1 transposase [Trichonephila clavipes]|nr:transposable element Tcb1 transposase [Trichonephila clavipes]
MRTGIFASYCQKNRRIAVSVLSRQLSSATGTAVSRQTVYRRLGCIGLYARRPVRCVPLTATHCRLQITRSREHALWTPLQWSCVMFPTSPECNDDRPHLSGCHSGTTCTFVSGRHEFSDLLFMDDNARPHRANIVHECLQSEDIIRMDWPAHSPDLNPIEHVWDMLDRRIAVRQPPPTCLPELWRALLDEWCNIPQDQIDNLILSMTRRWLRKQKKKLRSIKEVLRRKETLGSGQDSVATALREETLNDDNCKAGRGMETDRSSLDYDYFLWDFKKIGVHTATGCVHLSALLIGRAMAAY